MMNLVDGHLGGRVGVLVIIVIALVLVGVLLEIVVIVSEVLMMWECV